jgi:uncharacterized membrane protein
MAFQDFLGSIGASIMDPLQAIWYWLVKAVPDLIAAIIIIIVGYLVALGISSLLAHLLRRIGFDEWLFEKAKLADAVGKFDLTHVLALVTKWYIIVLFLGATAAKIRLGALAVFLSTLSVWIPQVIVAVIIGLIGIAAGMYVERRVIETRAKAARIVAMLSKWVIYVFTTLIVLSQIGLKVALAEKSFLIILGGAVAMIALVLGIGFGLGFKDEAKRIIVDIKKKL